MIALACLGLCACARVQDDPAGFRVVFEDQDAGRLAVCSLSGREFQYITPDSLFAFGPVTDSTRAAVYFLARPRSAPDALVSVYVVDVHGNSLRQVTDVPFSVLDVQITPDAATLVFLGKYPDQENVRAYQMRVGESGFHAVTPATKSVHDPAMAPGGLNFVWNDGTQSDTLYVSSLQEYLTLPIYVFPYTQVSLSWPDGRSFAAVGGSHRSALCYMLLQKPNGAEVREESVLVPEKAGISISQPAFHPDGQRILYVQTEQAGKKPSQLRVIDRNSLEVTRIPTSCEHPAHPAWVHL